MLEHLSIAVLFSVLMGLTGFVVGYYKTKAENERRFVGKEECKICGVKQTILDQTDDLNKGDAKFEQILIAQTSMKKDIERLIADFADLSTRFDRWIEERRKGIPLYPGANRESMPT